MSAARAKRRIFGLDPGSVNMGLAEYDIVKKTAVSLERVQFRESGDRTPDLGNARLVASVVKWISANAARFSNAIIFIESQPPQIDPRDRTMHINREVHSVQVAFQTVFGDRCIPVSPHSVKNRYASHFPTHPKASTFAAHRVKENQYAYDKRNAIIEGRKLVPDHVRIEYERKNPHKKDDAYDAFWLARYGADFMINDDGEVSSKPTPLARRKKADGPHPRARASSGGAKPKARAKAKTSAKPKARAKPKPKAAPKPKTAGQKRKISKEQESSTDEEYIDITADIPHPRDAPPEKRGRVLPISVDSDSETEEDDV